MIALDKGPVEVKILSAGSNWLKVGSMIALGLTGYYSQLPKGSSVSVHTAHTGVMCLEGPKLVDEGRYHFGMTTPNWLGRTAMEGRGGFGFAERPANLRAVAAFPHFDQLALAVRSDLGIRSIRELKEKKIPLRISTAPTHLDHPVGWVLDALFAEYGFAIEDFERWGGSVIFGDRQPNFMEKVPGGRKDRVSTMKAGVLNAVFDEALMTKPWEEIANSVDLTYLPIEEEVLASLQRKYCMQPGVIPKGRLRGVTYDVPTIDFSGWIFYCHADLPDRLVQLTLEGLEQQAGQIESLFQPGQGLTGPIEMKNAWRGIDFPLHPGAERFYRERGTLS